MLEGKDLASSNGNTSKPPSSKNTSTLGLLIGGNARLENLTNLIPVPTPSTNQESVEYSSGTVFPINSILRPLVNTTPLELIYFSFPKISVVTSNTVESEILATLNFPTLLRLFPL